VKATFDFDEVERGLDAMLRAGRSPASVLSSFRRPSRRDQMDHGVAQSGPESRWAPRAKATTTGKGKRRAKARRRRILGRLSSAVITMVVGHRLVVESQVKWSDIHQRGGVAGRGAKIPARPFLWWSSRILVDIGAAIVTHVGEKF